MNGEAHPPDQGEGGNAGFPGFSLGSRYTSGPKPQSAAACRHTGRDPEDIKWVRRAVPSSPWLFTVDRTWPRAGAPDGQPALSRRPRTGASRSDPIASAPEPSPCGMQGRGRESLSSGGRGAARRGPLGRMRWLRGALGVPRPRVARGGPGNPSRLVRRPRPGRPRPHRGKAPASQWGNALAGPCSHGHPSGPRRMESQRHRASAWLLQANRAALPPLRALTPNPQPRSPGLATAYVQEIVCSSAHGLPDSVYWCTIVP